VSNYRFESELNKLIDAELARLHEELGLGLAVKTMDQYREYVGKITAYTKVRDDFCREVQTKLNEG
jgi:hypothetical protein